VRSTVSRALEARISGTSMPEHLPAVLSQAVSTISTSEAPLEHGVTADQRLDIGMSPTWVWAEAEEDGVMTDLFVRRFKEDISDSIASEPTVLRSPTDSMLKTLEGGVRILRSLIPDLAHSVMTHVQVVAIADVADQSKWGSPVRSTMCQNVSTHTIPGTIFLSPSPLRTPWHAAEALFHEALHKKLSDIVLTSNVFRDKYDTEDSVTIHAVWNRDLSWNSNQWPVDRALFAYHFYVYIAFFYRCIRERGHLVNSSFAGPHIDDVEAKERIAQIKAQYLHDEIVKHGRDELGPSGLDLVRWLSSLQEQLFDEDDDLDAEVYLLLHRYEKETAEVGRVLDDVPQQSQKGDDTVHAPYEDWSATRLADHLVHSEIVGAYRILSILGEEDPPSFPFYDGDRWSIAARSYASPEVRAHTFRSIRSFIIATLRGASVQSFDKKCETRRIKTLRSIIRDVVEHSSRHLDDLKRALKRE